MAFTEVTITGGPFTDAAGNPLSGTGTATLSDRLVNGTQEVEPEPVQGQLNAEGMWVNTSGEAYTLVAVDDTGTEPPGAFYSWVLNFDSAPIDPFEATISHVSGTVD